MKTLIEERDEMTIEIDEKKNKCESLVLHRLEMIAEMEQIRFFQSETKMMVQQLSMHEKSVELEKERDLIEVRNVEKEKEELKQLCEQMEDEISELKTLLNSSEEERDKAKDVAQTLGVENDALHDEIHKTEKKNKAKEENGIHGNVNSMLKGLCSFHINKDMNKKDKVMNSK